MPKLTPETAAVLLESTVSTELSFYVKNIRNLIAQGVIDPSSRLFRLANLDRQGWSDPWTEMTAPNLVDLLERSELDLEGHEKAWLLYCILYEFVHLERRPLAILRTQNKVLNGDYQARTRMGQYLIDLWLEIIYSGVIGDQIP